MIGELTSGRRTLLTTPSTWSVASPPPAIDAEQPTDEGMAR